MRYDDLFTGVLTDQLDAPDDNTKKRKIVICTTPRTGGHACCQQLNAFGLGVPTEYFQIQFAAPLMRRWSGSPNMEREEIRQRAEEYGSYLFENRTRNGFFSAKIFYDNLPFMRDALGADDDSWFYLRLLRRDKIAQTVSLLSMFSTGRAFDSDEQIEELVNISSIGLQNIHNAVRYLHQNELAWSSYFASIPQERKSKIFLEDFANNSETTLRLAVADWVGNFPLDTKKEIKTKRYSSDSDLKERIKEQYAGQIADIWNRLPATDF